MNRQKAACASRFPRTVSTEGSAPSNMNPQRIALLEKRQLVLKRQLASDFGGFELDETQRHQTQQTTWTSDSARCRTQARSDLDPRERMRPRESGDRRALPRLPPTSRTGGRENQFGSSTSEQLAVLHAISIVLRTATSDLHLRVRVVEDNSPPGAQRRSRRNKFIAARAAQLTVRPPIATTWRAPGSTSASTISW